MASNAIVVGGGFAGLEAAIHLRKAGLAVTLVSDRPYLWIYPTSIWVVTGEREFEDVCLDLADVARRHQFTFREGKVESISGARRAVTVDGEELVADHLVLAIGGAPLKPKGVEHTFGLSGSPESASRLHDALEKLLTSGGGRIAMGFGGNPKDPSAVRGGPVFEVMFNVVHMLRKRGVRDSFQLAFFAPMPSPGERMGKKAVAAIQQMLGEMGVEMRFGKKIDGFLKGGTVLFEDGSLLPSDLTVFIPAQGGHPVLTGSDLPRNEAGFVQIDEGMRRSRVPRGVGGGGLGRARRPALARQAGSPRRGHGPGGRDQHRGRGRRAVRSGRATCPTSPSPASWTWATAQPTCTATPRRSR